MRRTGPRERAGLMAHTGRHRRAGLIAMLAGLVLICTGLVLPGVSASAAPGTVHAPVSGAGSTWSSNAIDQWIRNVWDNYKWRVTFDKQGSSKGRQLFADGTVDFGVSEIPYALSGSDAVDPRPNRPLAYMPIVAGGTSFMYNLVIGGQRVTNLRLSGDTVTRIFTNQITQWDDPAIQADNPGLAMPAIPIIPVVRSDGSGTSAQFTSWMRDQYPQHWQAYCDMAGRANCGITSNYPIVAGSRFQGKNGSDGVSGFVSQAHAMGAITYVEYSYALNARFPVAKILNKAGYYTEPTASNVTVALLGAQINQDPNSPDYLTQQLGGVYNNADARTYPLSSYSYMILPTDLSSGFTENKGLTLADFSAYFLCEGQQQAERLGYSPLPINLVQAGQSQIQKIPGGNPVIKGIPDCNNPTFDPNGGNRLANTAPYPQDCDKVGPTQCATGTGGAKDQATSTSRGPGTSTGTGPGGPTGTNSGAGGPGTGTNGTGTGQGTNASNSAAGPAALAGGDTTTVGDTTGSTGSAQLTGIPVHLGFNALTAGAAGTDRGAPVLAGGLIGAGVLLVGTGLPPIVAGIAGGGVARGARGAGTGGAGTGGAGTGGAGTGRAGRALAGLRRKR